MGNVLRTKETLITTNEGLKLIRRERTVRMPNGSLRHPVDYYDATPGTVKSTDLPPSAHTTPILLE